MRDVVSGMKLKVRVVHYCRQGTECWYADIDDAGDRQPDDPYWYVDGCRTQSDALTAACTQLAGFDQSMAAGVLPVRLSGANSQAA
jgi:hypothetical protein